MFLLLWVCLLKVSAKRTRNNIQHVLVCSLWTRTWTHSCRFTQRRRQKTSEEEGEIVKKGQRGKQEFGFLFEKLWKYRHRLSQHKIRPYWKRFHLFDWRAKFLSRSSTFVGDCSESDKANWPSDNQMDVFLKFFQCVHRKLLSRRVRTEEQICRRDPQIQNKDIIMFCAPCFFLVTAQRCHFTSSVNKTKDYSHRELSRCAYNTYYSNILCLKRSLNCTVCGTCVPLTADAL